MSTILNVLRPVVRSVIKPIDSRGGVRWALNFDGVGIRGTLANRAIDITADIDLTFYAPSNITVRQTIISQQINLLGASEFLVESSVTGVLQLIIGGAALNALTVADGYEAGKKFRIRLVGTVLTVWKTNVADLDAPIKVGSFTRGTTVEPAAITVIGAAVLNSAGTYTRHFAGIQRDVKINGILWKMDQYNQATQPSLPSGNNMTIFNTTSANWVEIQQ